MMPNNENLEDDDLEEGEVKDDDDDDEDEVENSVENNKDDVLSERKSSSSEAELTPPRAPSPPSSSSSSSSPSSSSSSSSSSASSSSSSSASSHEHPSSKSSSRTSRHHSSSSRRNGTSNNRIMKSVISSRRLSEDGMAEKAAKLISMRTKLLEARSREFELRLSKGKSSGTTSTAPPIALLEEKNVKMTIAEPTISYSENPNPRSEQAPVPDISAKKKSRSKSKSETKERKSKKSKKKKSPKKSKRHKRSNSSSKKSVTENKLGSPSIELPYENNAQENQGPRTPPDNQVLTLDDEQIEWPSHLIRMTICEPPITYSVNPASVMEQVEEISDGRVSRKRKSSRTGTERKKSKTGEARSSISCSPTRRQTPAISIDDATTNRKFSSPKVVTQESDLNADYTWFYSYYADSFEMDHKQAHHQALSTIISSGLYGEKQLENWLSSRSMTRVTDIMLHKPAFPFTLRESAYNPSSRRERKTEELENLNREFKNPIEKVVTRLSRNQFGTTESNDDRVQVKEDKVLPKVEENEQETDTVSNKAEPSDSADRQTIKIEKQFESSDPPQATEPINQILQVKTEASVEHKELAQNIVPVPVKPKYTMVRSQKEIVLPNGQVLPPGTIQKFVHPYPRMDSEILGPYYDLY